VISANNNGRLYIDLQALFAEIGSTDTHIQ